jgi:hypothetical protein
LTPRFAGFCPQFVRPFDVPREVRLTYGRFRICSEGEDRGISLSATRALGPADASARGAASENAHTANAVTDVIPFRTLQELYVNEACAPEEGLHRDECVSEEMLLVQQVPEKPMLRQAIEVRYAHVKLAAWEEGPTKRTACLERIRNVLEDMRGDNEIVCGLVRHRVDYPVPLSGDRCGSRRRFEAIRDPTSFSKDIERHPEPTSEIKYTRCFGRERREPLNQNLDLLAIRVTPPSQEFLERFPLRPFFVSLPAVLGVIVGSDLALVRPRKCFDDPAVFAR